MANYLSYFRLPLLAASGIASIGSGLLYYKQMYVHVTNPKNHIDIIVVISYTLAIYQQVQTLTKAFLGHPNSESQIGKTYEFPLQMAKP